MSVSTATHYDLLGVHKRTRPEEVRAAYRRLAQKYHPDKQLGNADAVRVMAALNEAYAVLSDPARRAEYDQGLADMRKQARAQRAQRLAALQAADAAWPWWLLFATLLFCAAAVGVSVYKGYVPGAAGTSGARAVVHKASGAAVRPAAKLVSN